MKNVLKAKRAEIITWTAADLEADLTQTGFEGSPTQVIQVWPPQKRAGGQVIEGEPEEIAVRLAEIIKEMQIAAG